MSMNIYQCERLAKERGFDSMKFTAFFPAGPKVCTWLDAYFGIFQIDGTDGFVMAREVDERFPDLQCIPHEEAA